MLFTLLLAVLVGQEPHVNPDHGVTVYPPTEAVVLPPKTKPKVEYRITPIIGLRDTPITVRLVIRNADEKFWCPAILVEWREGTTSEYEADCDPYEDADPDEVAGKVYRIQTPPMRRGYYVVKIWLKKADKVIWSDTVGTNVELR